MYHVLYVLQGFCQNPLPTSHLFSILTLCKAGIVLTRSRRYYMAAWRYEISVRELEKKPKHKHTLEEKFCACTSKQTCNMF